MKINSLEKKFTYLESLGFKTPSHCFIVGIEAIPELYQKSIEWRKGLNYDIDGIVFSIDDVEKLEALGYLERGKPKGQIALKFPPEIILSKIIGVIFSFKGGQDVSMVARIEPVEIMGAIVRKASLKSLKWVKEHNVGIGSVVEMTRGGDVIPKIVKCLTPGVTPFEYPKECPYCGYEVLEGEAQLYCSNPMCSAKEAARMYNFLKILGVKGLAWKSLLKYFGDGVTLLEFVSQSWDIIEEKIASNSSISKVIWKKIRKQLEEYSDES